MAIPVVIGVQPALPPYFYRNLRLQDMTETTKIPSSYLKPLLVLEEKLKFPAQMSYSESGLKLLLLSLFYETQEVNQQFLQVKEELSEETIIPYIPQYDKDVDYAEWSSERRLQLDPQPPVWPDAESNAKINQALNCLIDAMAAQSEESLELTPFKQKLNDVLWSRIDSKILWSALKESLKNLRKTLGEIGKQLSGLTINKEVACKLYEGRFVSYNLKDAISVREEYQAWKQQWDEKRLIRLHLKGKYLDEMKRLFLSDFLKAKLAKQYDIDPNGYDEEELFQKLKSCSSELPHEPLILYGAIRELFEYQCGWLLPITSAIGKYFYNERKCIHEEHQKACFRFIQMTTLIMADAEQPVPKTAANNRKKKQKQTTSSSGFRGRTETVIFLEPDFQDNLKQAVCNILGKYRNGNDNVVHINSKTFILTRFLLSIYFASVEGGKVTSIKHSINSGYYRFLNDDCKISKLASEKNFRKELKKVTDTQMDFHELTTENLKVCKASGVLTADEYTEWQQMVGEAKRLLIAEGVLTEEISATKQ